MLKIARIWYLERSTDLDIWVFSIHRFIIIISIIFANRVHFIGSFSTDPSIHVNLILELRHLVSKLDRKEFANFEGWFVFFGIFSISINLESYDRRFGVSSLDS